MDFLMKYVARPLVRYSDAHIYLAMYEVSKNDRMSRKKLADALGVGEGSVRSVVNLMKDWGVIETRRTGIRLTKFGRFTLDSIPIELMEIYSDKYAIGAFQQGVLVKGVADKVTTGLEQRDSGIRHGSNGASVFVMKDGRLVFPKDWDIDKEDPTLAGQIRSTGMHDGDAFLLVGSDDIITAKVSAVSVALEML